VGEAKWNLNLLRPRMHARTICAHSNWSGREGTRSLLRRTTTRGSWTVTAEQSSITVRKNSSPSSCRIRVNDLLGCQPCLTVTLMVIGWAIS
jgi:hypothetical protein